TGKEISGADAGASSLEDRIVFPILVALRVKHFQRRSRVLWNKLAILFPPQPRKVLCPFAVNTLEQVDASVGNHPGMRYAAALFEDEASHSRALFVVTEVGDCIRHRLRFGHHHIPIFPGCNDLGSSEQVTEAPVDLLTSDRTPGLKLLLLGAGLSE